MINECGVQMVAFETLEVEAKSAPPEQHAEWRLTLARSELEVQRCRAEAAEGLAMFLGRRHLLERWGITEPDSP